MEAIEYRRMFEQEERHWWFQSRLLMIEGLLQKYILPHYVDGRPRLLDLGCGTGMFLQRRQLDCSAAGLDYSNEALRLSKSRRLQRVMRGDATRLPVASGSIDIVTAFDLIEHVARDQALVEEVWRVLRPGGWLLASVPAHPALWSSHDVSLHHHRRYSRASFERLFTNQQWRCVRHTGSFALILPIAAVKRLSERVVKPRGISADTRPTPPWLNRLLIHFHRWEAAWLENRDLPTGLSLVTIRQKM